jgi:hypothetical protein
MVMTSDSQAVDAQSEFYAALVKKAQDALGSIGNVALTPIQTGGQAFYYNYLFNGNFVRTTFAVLDGRVGPGSIPGTVAMAGSFSDVMGQLINSISWQLSAADQTAITLANAKAGAAANSLVTMYEGIFGAITADMLTNAGVAQPIDYVIDYEVRQIWSGTKAAGTTPLNLSGGVQNLRAELPNLPSAAVPLLSTLSMYLNEMASVWAILDDQSAQNYRATAIVNNIQKPSSKNGGMTTWAPSGATVAAVGYDTSPSTQALVNALSGPATSSLEILFSASQTQSSELKVTVDGSADAEIPIEEFILGVHAQAKFSLFSAQGTGTEASVSASFPNPTLVAVDPAAFDQASSDGWYDPDPISQAAANTGKDVSGFQFATPPAFKLEAGGNFGRFLALAVSQQPTITITYSKGDYSVFQQSFEENSSWTLSLLGLPLATVDQGVYEASSSENQEDGSFAVTLRPPDQAGLPSYDLSAFIIAAVVAYPGATAQ